jgi:ribosomal protein L11 methyltransferase
MIRLAVRVDDDPGGVVLAELLELSPAGVEERATDDGGLEYVIYGAPGELPQLPELEAATGERLVRVSSEEIPDDWSERWKAWHRPVDVSWRFRRMRVRPPWEAASEDPDVIELVIDPGQAFGTGAHATTRLCLELLLSLSPGGAFADWGTGTGVLAIAAARLGYDPVIAVDYDPLSVEAAAENARVNGADVRVSSVDLRREAPPHAPTVCANLLRPLLVEVASGLTGVPERLILSGLLREEADEVAAAYAVHGLVETARREAAEWSAVLLERS